MATRAKPDSNGRESSAQAFAPGSRVDGKRVEITLTLDGEFSEFGPDRQQNMVRILAALLQIDPGNIRILKAHAGSIVIMLEMPASTARYLYDVISKQDFRIMDLDLISVSVDGKEIINEASKWQTKYKAKDGHAVDGRRQDAILLAYLGAVLISSTYLTAFFWANRAQAIIAWAGADGILLAWMLVTLVITLIAIAVFSLLFRAAVNFFDRLYEREGTDSRARLGLRFFGIPPSPPPFRHLDFLKYPFVLIRDGKVDPRKDWIMWLGGPARLLIFDGNALYVERGNKFSRVIGPSNSLPFLDATERVRAVVDLRPHVLVKPGGIKAWTKDGILVEMDVRLECQIGLEGMTEATAKGLLYPYGPISVKKAVEKTPVRYDQDNKRLAEVDWPDKAWGSVQGVLATYIFSHTLDELFLAENGVDQVHSRDVTAGWLQSLNEGLKEGGTRLLSLQITNVMPVDEEVKEKRIRYWEAIKQSAVTVSDGEAKAHGIRAHEKARAEAERDLIDAIVDAVGTSEVLYDDQLVMALSGILDQSLKDNDLGLYMPGETLGSLQKLRELLKPPEAHGE